MSKTLISILGGLGGMFGWGTSDFFANQASDKVGHTKALFWSQIAGILLILLAVLVVEPSFVLTPYLIFLIVICGIGYALGYLYFYNAFEIGNVSVVSAVINSQNIFIVLIAYFLFGQRLTPFQIPALILLIIGILMVSVDFKELTSEKVSLVKGVKETLIAATMFGVLYWPINEYVAERANWLVVTLLVKAVAIASVYLIARFKSQKLSLPGKGSIKKIIIAVGLLEAIGVLSTSYGVAYGDSIIVGPISSSLTVVTVTLAFIFLKERLKNIQWAGIAVVIIGIILSAF